MNTKEIIEYIQENATFIEKYAPSIYSEFNLTKKIFQALYVHPNPYHLPKARRKMLYELQQKVALLKKEHLGETEAWINEAIVQEQRKSHARIHPFQLRKRWLNIN